MIGPYIQAVERQLEWVRALHEAPRPTPGALQAWKNIYAQTGTTWAAMAAERHRLKEQVARSDTFYMNRQFCELTDLATSKVPDDLRFEIQWLQSLRGFLYRDFSIGLMKPNVLRADQLFSFDGKFQAFCWEPRNSQTLIVRWFTFLEGNARTEDALLIKEIHLYDQESLKTAQSRPNIAPEDYPIIKWLYSAFHLMAQRVAVTLNQTVDRSVRRRAERNKESAPEIVKIISLRRLEEDRAKETQQRGQVEWHWQWEVRGHWRNQFYPSENIHKPVFVEAYIKGPTDKPFKSPGLKLFAAVR